MAKNEGRESSNFGRLWVGTTLITSAGFALLWWLVPDLRDRVGYLAILLVGFAVFTWRAYRVAERFAAHENPARLLQYVMALTFVKLVFGVSLVFGYAYWVRPVGITFIWPFFWSYLTFTSLETYALIRLSFATSPKRRDD